ncbi:MAG: peptidylprolyl isomerase [Cyanobacteria bacterium J06638_28]
MTMRLQQWLWTVCLMTVVFTLSACTTNDATNDVTESSSPAEVPIVPEVTEALRPGDGLPVLLGAATVEMQINGGRVLMTLDGENAPITAGNFVDLVQRGFYDGVLFHRVVKSPEPFVVQAGDPQTKDPSIPESLWGTGGFVDPDTQQPREIPLEIKPAGAAEPVYSRTFETLRVQEPPELQHTRGAIAMARSQLPDSASSQFYIALGELPFLDGSYAVFGYVTEGMDIVDDIEMGDVIESVTVTSGLENLQQPE